MRPLASWRTGARRATLLAALAVGGGCAGIGPWLETPKVDVVGVRLDRVEGSRAQFGVDVELANPNARPLDVEAFDASIAIEGEVVATAALAAPVRVPANGRARAELVARTGVDALVRAGIAAMRRGATAAPGHGPSLAYSIEGAAIFNGGLRVPFVKRGELGQGKDR